MKRILATTALVAFATAPAFAQTADTTVIEDATVEIQGNNVSVDGTVTESGSAMTTTAPVMEDDAMADDMAHDSMDTEHEVDAVVDDTNMTTTPMPAEGAIPTDNMTDNMTGGPVDTANPGAYGEVHTNVDADTPPLGAEWRGEDLIGANIQGANGESVGDVSDVLLAEDGSIEFFLVDVGGFLGIGTRTVAIAFDAANITQEGDEEPVINIDMTEEQIEALPAR